MLARDVTSSLRSRSRSRSRSNVRSVRPRIMPVSRSIRYNGVNHISRVVNTAIAWSNAATPGYTLGVSTYDSFGITVSPTTLTILGSNVNYTLVNLPNVTELSNLYDLLKIDKVEFTFTVCGQNPNVTTTLQKGGPLLYVSTDINDVIPNTLTQTQQQEKVAMLSPTNGPQTYTLKPKYQQLVYYTSIASANAARSGYVASNLDIPHYGLRLAVADPTNTAVHSLNISAKFFFSLKDVK